MIRSLLALTAATVCVLLIACSETDPEVQQRDKGPRPVPSTPVQAPGMETEDVQRTDPNQPPGGGG